MIVEVTCETENGLVELEVELAYEPLVPGRFYGRPEDCCPDEGGFIEVIEVALAGTTTKVSTEDLPEDFPSDEELYELATND